MIRDCATAALAAVSATASGGKRAEAIRCQDAGGLVAPAIPSVTARRTGGATARSVQQRVDPRPRAG
eukprot:276731-Prymnesium_polylepis.1